MIASPATASFQTRAERAASRKCFTGVGTLFVSDKGAPQAGQVMRQTFRQCFGTAPCALARVPLRAGPNRGELCCGRSIQRIVPGVSMNVIAMSAIGSHRSFSI